MLHFNFRRFPSFKNASAQIKIIISISYVLVVMVLAFLVASVIVNLIGNISIKRAISYSDFWLFSRLSLGFSVGGLTSPLSLNLFFGGVAAFLAALAFLILPAISIKPKNIYGDAKFARPQDIIKANLRKTKGIICGWTGSLSAKYVSETLKKPANNIATILRFGGSEHVITYAPTRAGKGVGLVMPNLFSWPDALVVLDIKKECWQTTSQWRKEKGFKVFLFEPLSEDPAAIKYNPFANVDLKTDNKITEIDLIASLLIPIKSATQPFFDEAARKLFSALALYLLEDGYTLTIGEVFKLACNISPEILAAKIDMNESILTVTCKTMLGDFAQMEPRTFDNVRSSLTTHLGLWKNPKIEAATSKNTIDLREIRDKKISIFVAVPPRQLDLFKPLISLFFQQVIDLNMKETRTDTSNQLLIIFDEFTSIGRLEFIEKQIAYLAGYNIRLLLVVQSPSQLVFTYGREQSETILSNCGVEVIFPTKQLAIAKEISARCGEMSYFKEKIAPKASHIDEYRRPLLLPQELMQLENGKIVLLTGGHPPVLANRFVFFNESLWRQNG